MSEQLKQQTLYNVSEANTKNLIWVDVYVSGTEGSAGTYASRRMTKAQLIAFLKANMGLTLTTTGTSGVSTLIGDTLNIPKYLGGSGNSTQVAYWNGVDSVTSNSGFTYNSSTNSIKLSGSNGGLFVDTSGDTSPASYPTSPHIQAFLVGEGKTSIYQPNRMSGTSEGTAIEQQNIVIYTVNPSQPSAGQNGPGIAFIFGDDGNTGTSAGIIQIVRAEGSGDENEDGTLMVFGTRPNASPAEKDVKEGIRIGRNQWTGIHYKPGANQSPPAMLTIGTNLADDNTIGIRETNITPTSITDYGQFYVKSDTKPYFLTSNGVEYDLTALNPRLQTIASSATVTPTSANDLVTITAQAVGLTLANPTGSFAEGQPLMIRIKDNGTARTIAFDTNYRAIGITLPTTTVISKTLYLGVIYNSTDGKFDVIGLNQEA
jgi:hypothetical protein